MEKGFTIDATTRRTVIRIEEHMLTPGDINLSCNDISNVLLQDGETVIAFGSGAGESRGIKACDNAPSNYRTACRTTRKPTKLLLPLRRAAV